MQATAHNNGSELSFCKLPTLQGLTIDGFDSSISPVIVFASVCIESDSKGSIALNFKNPANTIINKYLIYLLVNTMYLNYNTSKYIYQVNSRHAIVVRKTVYKNIDVGKD